MAFIQWRRFNFFDKEAVKEPEGHAVFDKLTDINIAAVASGRGQIVIGDHEGVLFFINRQLQMSAFKAYEIRVSHVFQMKQHNLLLTIGEDEQGINPLIKVWNLDKMEKGSPVCTRIARAIPGNKPTPVTCFTVHENLNWMAIGFENGSVVLLKGDVTRDRHSKQRIAYDCNRPITGVHFKSVGKSVILFAITESNIMTVNVTANDQKTELDKLGCSQGCSVISDSSQENQLVVGRQDAVYFYQHDGRGPCLAFEGEKVLLQWFRGYLVVVGKENKALPRASAIAGQAREMNIVTVYDIQNKFIGYSAPFPEVVDVVSEWGSLYVVCGDGKMFHLQEKDTQTKLEMLFKKNMYMLAINLAKSQQYDQEGLIDIFTQYGDHLYGKGDHDGAIDQYIKTIGKLEASYVIRKFLDAQRIHNLTKYLQALHKAQLATEEHTTLLLNCYTKLKDVSKLDEFIMTKDREVDFDVETAIKVCRQAGYFKHALFLAEKHNIHEWYLKIQLEDSKDYSKSLEYIGKLSFTEAESNLKQYGKVLMTEAPQQTTELLKRLCTDYRPSDQPLVDQSVLEGGIAKIQKASAEEFIHIFVNNSSKLTEFLEHMVRVQPSSPVLVYNTLLELYLQEVSHEQNISMRTDKERKTLTLLQNPDAGYDLDQALVLCQMNNFKAGILYLYEKAQLYQQILRYHMEHSEHSHVIDACKRFGSQDPNLWVQALAYFARKEDNCKTQLMEVLTHIDKKNLLPPLLVIQTLAQNSTATLSVVKDYIIRRLQLENDQISEDERLIKQYREDTERTRKQIEELKTSSQDPNLWVQALAYFARKEDNCKTQLMEVLTHIDKKNLLPPLLVIQTLAQNSTATLSVVKDYIIRRLQLENDQISEDERLIKQYREDTERTRKQIEELKTSAKIFQASKCSICNHPLEVPSVHFLCEPHSYHLHCFESYAENENECPACMPENRKIMDFIRAQEQSKDLHEFFHNQLERAPDGFSVVAEYFGRGVFNKVTVLTDSPVGRPKSRSKNADYNPDLNPFF